MCRQSASEVLLVADVRHGAIIRLPVVAIAEGKGILAPGDDVVRTHGQLAAPGGPPGQPDDLRPGQVTAFLFFLPG